MTLSTAPIDAMRFGVEIEFNTTATARQTVSALARHGVAARDANYSGTSSAEWLVKPDGSIGNGWEIVSPPLSLPDLLSGLRYVCDAIATLPGAHASNRCGLHVHVSFNNAAAQFYAVRNVIRRAINFEDTFDLLQPVARRGSANGYCKSNRAVFGADPVAATQHIWSHIEHVSTLRGLVRMFCPHDDRYFKVNLCSLHRHGTVEFRHHAGTIDYTEISNWVRFLAEFCNVAMQQQRLWKRPAAHVESPRERLRKMLREISPDVARYIRNRFLSMSV